MDIRRLSYFTQIAELGTVNATAEQVNLSQPSLSRQIRLLEEELGVSLFTRHRSGMQLTREGQELRMRISGPLRQLELALQDIKSMASSAGGNIALGLPPTEIYALASSLMSRVEALAPNISLYIVEGYAGHLLNSVERGEIDIALLYGPPANWRCTTEDLLTERMMLVGPADCDLCPDRPVDFKTLASLPLILPTPANQPRGIRQLVEKISEVSDARESFPLRADSLQLIKAYLEAGLGYSLIPYSAFSREAESGQFKYAPLETLEVTRHLLIGTHPGGQFPRAIATIKKLIQDEIKDQVALGKWKAELHFDTRQA